jgi:aminopeptidase N
MRSVTHYLAFLMLLGTTASNTHANQKTTADGPHVVHHDLKIAINLQANEMEIEDTLTVPALEPGETQHLTFHLRDDFKMDSLTPNVNIKSLSSPEKYQSSDEATASDASTESSTVTRAQTASASSLGHSSGQPGIASYVVTLPPETVRFTVRYQGQIAPVLSMQQKGASSMPRSPKKEHDGRKLALVNAMDRIELSGSDWWVPTFSDSLVSFKMSVSGLPGNWRILASGDQEQEHIFRSWHHMDQIHLIASPWHQTKETIAGIELEILLNKKDPVLARRYIEASKQFLVLYNDLIGPFPYKRFSVAEANKEVGYALPGYTLIGSRLLRFPFILFSSYPHELLHNWLGNSIFTQHTDGNWSEGLTTYLADHLMQENRGQAARYRSTALARYKDYVSQNDDVVLKHFRSGDSRASQAVGYGKWMMVVHMLRHKIGDEAFREALKIFYRNHAFRRASFHDFRRSLEEASGADLKPFFRAYVDRPGAPVLAWNAVQTSGSKKGLWNVQIEVSQIQNSDAFPIDLPVLVTFSDGTGMMKRFPFDDKALVASFSVPKKPVRLDLDPQFDIFRLLGDRELPPRFSQLLGAQQSLFILPSQSSKEEIEGWKAWVAHVCGTNMQTCKTVFDSAEPSLPTDRSVWILGYANLLRGAATVGALPFHARFDDYFFRYQGVRYQNSDMTLALVTDHPSQPHLALGFVGSHEPASIGKLGRKIPHYGSYSYLLFKDGANNVAKGRWQRDKSSQAIFTSPNSSPNVASIETPVLAPLPNPFDAERLKRTANSLKENASAGKARRNSSLTKAFKFLEREFADSHLAPAGDQGFRQCWAEQRKDGKPIENCNLVAAIRGNNSEASPIIVGAQMSLAASRDKTRIKNRSKRNPNVNASNNFSGVSVLNEVARLSQARGPLSRDIIFILYSKSDSSHAGEKHFTQSFSNSSQNSPYAILDIALESDTKGHSLVLSGTNTAKELEETVQKAKQISRVGAITVPGIPADHGVHIFEGRNIPSLRIGSAPTLQVVNDEDLVQSTAYMTHELILALADRQAPLTPALSPLRLSSHKSAATKLGIVPKYRYEGPGILLHAVGAASPAEKAGLQAGDVILKVDAYQIKTLRQFSLLLRRKKPGETILFSIKRNKDLMELKIIVDSK